MIAAFLESHDDRLSGQFEPSVQSISQRLFTPFMIRVRDLVLIWGFVVCLWVWGVMDPLSSVKVDGGVFGVAKGQWLGWGAGVQRRGIFMRWGMLIYIISQLVGSFSCFLYLCHDFTMYSMASSTWQTKIIGFEVHHQPQICKLVPPFVLVPPSPSPSLAQPPRGVMSQKVCLPKGRGWGCFGYIQQWYLCVFFVSRLGPELCCPEGGGGAKSCCVGNSGVAITRNDVGHQSSSCTMWLHQCRKMLNLSRVVFSFYFSPQHGICVIVGVCFLSKAVWIPTLRSFSHHTYLWRKVFVWRRPDI